MVALLQCLGSLLRRGKLDIGLPGRLACKEGGQGLARLPQPCPRARWPEAGRAPLGQGHRPASELWGRVEDSSCVPLIRSRGRGRPEGHRARQGRPKHSSCIGQGYRPSGRKLLPAAASSSPKIAVFERRSLAWLRNAWWRRGRAQGQRATPPTVAQADVGGHHLESVKEIPQILLAGAVGKPPEPQDCAPTRHPGWAAPLIFLRWCGLT